jgi:hypothetical protein
MALSATVVFVGGRGAAAGPALGAAGPAVVGLGGARSSSSSASFFSFLALAEG